MIVCIAEVEIIIIIIILYIIILDSFGPSELSIIERSLYYRGVRKGRFECIPFKICHT